MEIADRVFKCVDCNAEFVFTAGGQFFLLEKQLINDPNAARYARLSEAPWREYLPKLRRIVPYVERPQRFRLSLPVARRFCAVLAFRGKLKPIMPLEPRARPTCCPKQGGARS